MQRSVARALLAALCLCAAPGSRGSLATAHRRIERLESHVAFLHARLAEQLCDGNKQNEATATGAWCLSPEGEMFGHPMAPLHFLDAGVAPAVFDLLNNRSVLDVGAGSGQYGRFLLSRGHTAYAGIDGALNVEPFTSGFVRWADLTLPYDRDGGAADWVMSLEVGEHPPAAFEAQFLSTLHRNNRCGLILSWAVPNQPGKGHVNCLTNEQVRERVEPLGYALDAAVTEATRAKAELPWFKNTFMLFRRSNAPPDCAAPAAAKPR